MKNILKYYLMIVGFLTTLFMILFLVFIYGLVSNIGKVTPHLAEKEKPLADQPYYLQLSLVGDIQDQEVSEIHRVIEIIEARPRYQLYNLVSAIDQASRDERIQGLVIKSLDAQAGLNTFLELNDALNRFKKQGKKIYVFLSEADNKNYLLASAADQIFLQEEGSLYIPGVSASFIYVKDTLAKIGVEADFLRAGRFKSAPETFTSNAMSDDARMVNMELLKDIQETFIDTLVKNRKLSKEEMSECLNKGLITSKEALERKLVDEITYRDEFLDTVEKKLFPGVEPLNFNTYASISPKSLKGAKVDTRNKIALIMANGMIQMAPEEHQIRETSIWPEDILRKLEEVEDDSDIKALIIRVNSPGGSALASDIIWDRIRKLNTKKPVFVSMGSMAASGGYYISMGAEQIYAGPATLTGSIGVFGGKFVATSLLEKVGAHTETIAFSDGASLFSPVQSFTPNQRRDFDAFLHNTYRSFVTKASVSRGKEYEELDTVAQGRVWTGQQASKIGLIDGVGGYYEVIQAVKKKIGLDKDVVPTVVQVTVEPESLIDILRTLPPFLMEKFGHSSPPLNVELMRTVNHLTMLNSLLSRERSLFLMPYLVEIR
ncbi:MAG: signal peptide peptidase SppA [bacterium]